MARIKFKIGTTPGVHFNLPSREYGNSEVCIGKIMVDSGSLKSSGEFSIERTQLKNLVAIAKSILLNAEGACTIVSKCKKFKVSLSMTLRGHIKVEAIMSGYAFSQPNNREWYSESTFYLYPNAMKEVLDAESLIHS